MMKQLKFLETKRTPRYSLRKFSVGMVSVLLGVTIFGINFTNHSVKAATTNGNSQQTSAVVLTTAERTNTQKATGATGEVQQSSASNYVTEKVRQSSGSNNVTANNPTEAATTSQSSPETQGSAATANNSTEAATTLQSAPKTQGSADTDINSSAARLAARLAVKSAATNLVTISGTDRNAAARFAAKNLLAMNLFANSDTGRTATGTSDTDGNAAGTTGTGTNRNAAGTVGKDNINNQPAKENQELANKTNLTSSDNYSSNIYKGTDGKYYKIVTIYGNDYVYHAADIQANGTAFGQWPTTAEDTKNNINISKKDLGNGKTRWTVVFFPNKGLQNVGSKLSGLVSAKFGIALTSDYQIVGNVDMDVINDPNQTYTYYKFEDGSNSPTDITVQNPPAEVKFSFNPNTDVDPNTGLINGENMPAYNNKYLQGSYYFTTATSAGSNNLWQTYFFNNGNEVYYNNAYDGTTPYLGGDHDFHFNNFIIKNKTGVDGAKEGDLVIYDKRGGVNGVFNSVNFNQAMEFKSHGYASKRIKKDLSQYSSYVISFTTQHTDSHETELSPGPKNQQFSGISANIYSYQNGYYNMFSRLYGEQRALDSAGAVVKAKDIISGWVNANTAMAKIEKQNLNNAQIYALRNKIQNNVTDSDALNNIIKEGNSLNDAMKKLGNSIGQYDSDGSFADHKEDTTKASDRYKYANPDKKAAYDNATEVTKALINKDTGTYADQATVEKLTEAENKAWSALDGVKPTDAEKITPNVPTTTVPVADHSKLTETEKDKVKKNVEDANKGKFPDGTKVDVGDDGTATITYPDQTKSTDTIKGGDLIIGAKVVNNQVVDANGNVLVGWKVVNGQAVKSSDQPVMTREAYKAQQAKTLPQTGEKTNNLDIIGLLTASLVGLLGLGEKKKKKD